ncbi:MAG: biotin transporter BioY [Schwartzia sp.]|nr:biotin transporter BioY [Schwartzia sp. (in: firmicutes)]
MDYNKGDGQRLFDVRSMTRMAICVAILCISAYISIPVPMASAMVTALTVAMNLAAFLLTPRQTLVVMLLYTAIGAAGLPVFVGGAAGIGEIFGPRGGFLIAFLVAYPLVSLMKGSEISFRRYSLVAIVIGIPITYIGGLASLMAFTKLTFTEAVMAAVVPFIPGDIVKALLAAWLGVRLNRIFLRE